MPPAASLRLVPKLRHDSSRSAVDSGVPRAAATVATVLLFVPVLESPAPPHPVPDFHHRSFRSVTDSRFSTRRDDCRNCFRLIRSFLAQRLVSQRVRLTLFHPPRRLSQLLPSHSFVSCAAARLAALSTHASFAPCVLPKPLPSSCWCSCHERALSWRLHTMLPAFRQVSRPPSPKHPRKFLTPRAIRTPTQQTHDMLAPPYRTHSRKRGDVTCGARGGESKLLGWVSF